MLPSDNLTAKQRREKNGEVKSYNITRPMPWPEFKALPEDRVRLRGTCPHGEGTGRRGQTARHVYGGSTWELDRPGVWDDINRMRTLNTTQSQRRQQMHVCPLQLDIVDRLINRYSNPGELVLDPFGGLGTVALEAMKAGRRGYTIELNNGYFRDAVGYLKEYEQEDMNISLFDLMEYEK